jgi:hypothetical protein
MSDEPEIRELLPAETGLAFEAMRALRLVASFEAGAGEPSTVAGFRRAHSLAWGRYLHLDSGVDIDRADAHRLYLS